MAEYFSGDGYSLEVREDGELRLWSPTHDSVAMAAVNMRSGERVIALSLTEPLEDGKDSLALIPLPMAESIRDALTDLLEAGSCGDG